MSATEFESLVQATKAELVVLEFAQNGASILDPIIFVKHATRFLHVRQSPDSELAKKYPTKDTIVLIRRNQPEAYGL
jgi:hypothetical protein